MEDKYVHTTKELLQERDQDRSLRPMIYSTMLIKQWQQRYMIDQTQISKLFFNEFHCSLLKNYDKH